MKASLSLKSSFACFTKRKPSNCRQELYVVGCCAQPSNDSPIATTSSISDLPRERLEGLVVCFTWEAWVQEVN